VEAKERLDRRRERLLRSSHLPPGKTFETFDRGRLPKPLAHRLESLAEGQWVEEGANVLAFGLPGVGKSHAAAALGHALIDRGCSVLFTPTFRLVQELLVAKRDLRLPQTLRKLDQFDVLVLDDIGYVQQAPEEVEVLCHRTPKPGH
jgi:DNA replication protein DnaC